MTGTHPQVVIIADDLTGAADSAGYYATLGLTALARVRPGGGQPVDVLAVSTNSRDLDQREAVERTRRATEAAVAGTNAHDRGWWFKKIDSTLRGHPGAELAAVMSALGVERALVAPAFPAQGRTTVGGRQRVDGIPLNRTALAKSVSAADVSALFGPHVAPRALCRIPLSAVHAGPGGIGRAISEDRRAVFVADAASEEDLQNLVQAALAYDIRLLCGSAGLSRACARALDLRPTAPTPSVSSSHEGPILVVAGSRHAATAAQIKAAVQQGSAIALATADIADAEASGDEGVFQAASRRLALGNNVILTAVYTPETADDSHYASQLARLARRLVDEAAVGGLVLTGGDTAMATLGALGSTSIWLRGEIEPGIPWGRLWDGRCSGLPVVTKGGGFGSEDALMRCIGRLREESR